MRAAMIFFLARVIRAAIVGSLTRNARATSAVDRPHSSRSVSATCASTANAGWQHVQISRSRSSGYSSAFSGSSHATSSITSSGIARRKSVSRRSRSSARRRAVVVSHAPGFAGTPALPGSERPGVRVLHALLGEVEVARDAHRRGEDEAPLAPVRVSDGGGDVGPACVRDID